MKAITSSEADPLHILVVDDDPDLLQLTKILLKREQYSVHTASNGQECMRAIRQTKPDLLLLDISLPDISGIDICHTIKNDRSLSSIYVILLTGTKTLSDSVAEGLETGADGYLLKPIKNRELLAWVDAAFRIIQTEKKLFQEHRRLERIIDGARLGTWEWNVKTGEIVFNEKWAEIFGYTDDEIGTSNVEFWSKYAHPEDLLLCGQLMEKYLNGESDHYECEARMMHKNGNWIWIQVSGKIYQWDEAGKPLTVLGTRTDITVRKQYQEALQNSEESFRSIFERNSAAIAIIEPDTTISMVNEEYCKLGGFTMQEVIGTSWTKQIPPQDLERLKEYNRRRLINPKDAPDKYDFSFYRKDGEIRYAMLSVSMLSNKKIVASFLDITDRKQAEERNRFQANLLENVSDAIISTDLHYNIQYWNSGAEKQYGWEFSEVVGKPFGMFIINDYLETSLDAILQRILEDGYWKGEVIQNRRDGAHISVISTVSKVTDEKNETSGFIAINREITELKVAEQAMRISEEKYKTILNASPDGILLIDLKGIITEVSEIGLQLFGADSRDDLVHKDIFQFVPSDEEHTVIVIIEKATNEGLVQNIGLKFRKKNQSVFSGEASATLIQGPDGAPLSFMLTIRDISYRQKMATRQMHADRMASLGEMASGIAHEINQPLNIISMVMDKILFEAAKTETIDIDFLKIKSDKIFENITRIRSIIDHVRAFSRSHDDYVLMAFDINASIENASSMIMEQFKYLGIRLNLQLEKQVPKIFGSAVKFEQVIVNLLVNAKDAVIERKSKQEKYTEMIIEIRSFQENQFLCVEVADNGIGVNDEDIHNILLPFYTTKDEGKGTGLGLSICYQIIKEMGGTIAITSDGFNGTKIKLVLDIQRKK